jgi:IPT/TIG domain
MALPAITSISPSSGPTGGGTAVTIQGSGFTGATAVLFGGASATGIAVEGDTVIVATSPPGSGTANISVTTPSGSSAIVPASQFAYSAPPASSGSGSTFVDPGLTSQLVSNLVNVLNNSTSPDALEAQNIIMRRIALEGDVIGSRVPPPSNITQIGGYINLLTKLNENSMREQALAGILGVAGPTSPLGWISNQQPLAMVSIANDRPTGAAQPTIPLSVLVRSDFVSAVKAAVASIHQYGAMLPFFGSSVLQLPLGTPGGSPPTNMLQYIGRQLMVAPTAALLDPATDALALIQPSGSSAPYQIAANVLSAGPTPVTPADYNAVECTATTSTTVALTNASFVPVAPILATAGFYPASPLPMPANNTQTAWAVFTNITGLVTGTTQLGDELSLLYNAEIIANSAFAAILDWVWNGTAFAGP